LEEGGSSAVFTSWLRQLSCALQKANVASLRGAAAGGARAGRGAHNAPRAGEEAGEEDDDWLLEQVEELLVRAAGGAGW
jgi:hypothetical protein